MKGKMGNSLPTKNKFEQPRMGTLYMEAHHISLSLPHLLPQLLCAALFPSSASSSETSPPSSQSFIVSLPPLSQTFSLSPTLFFSLYLAFSLLLVQPPMIKHLWRLNGDMCQLHRLRQGQNRRTQLDGSSEAIEVVHGRRVVSLWVHDDGSPSPATPTACSRFQQVPFGLLITMVPSIQDESAQIISTQFRTKMANFSS